VNEPRPLGRPRLTFDDEDVSDAVSELIAERGYLEMTMQDIAGKLAVSRTKLYQSHSKNHVLRIVAEHSRSEITARISAAVDECCDSAEQLAELIRLQTQAILEMRFYMLGAFGDIEPLDDGWHRWNSQLETVWTTVVAANMREGNLPEGNARITARLILGMILWTSRWYRPSEENRPAQIADAVIRLVRLSYSPSLRTRNRKNGMGLS